MFAVLFLAVSQGGSSLLPAVDPATALSELRAEVAAYVEMGGKQAYRVKYVHNGPGALYGCMCGFYH